MFDLKIRKPKFPLNLPVCPSSEDGWFIVCSIYWSIPDDSFIYRVCEDEYIDRFYREDDLLSYKDFPYWYKYDFDFEGYPNSQLSDYNDYSFDIIERSPLVKLYSVDFRCSSSLIESSWNSLHKHLIEYVLPFSDKTLVEDFLGKHVVPVDSLMLNRIITICCAIPLYILGIKYHFWRENEDLNLNKYWQELVNDELLYTSSSSLRGFSMERDTDKIASDFIRTFDPYRRLINRSGHYLSCFDKICRDGIYCCKVAHDKNAIKKLRAIFRQHFETFEDNFNGVALDIEYSLHPEITKG